MNFENDEIGEILRLAKAPPPAPTDKFVANFIAQMDMDLPVENTSYKSRFGYGQFGAIAAAFLVVFGAVFALKSNDFIGTFAPAAIIAHNDLSAIVATQAIDEINNNYADEFASELVSYQDITNGQLDSGSDL